MTDNNRKAAMNLIILFGLVSLFGDIVYEGARSVNGPYLKTLGVSAATVGFIAGLGEFIGYAIRLLSGYFADKTRAYWLFTFIGYGMLATVPMLSLTGVWQVAALFIVLERLGKALRAPARDTIVSQASKQVGTGFGFGLSEFMDQLGALTGPLIFMALFMMVGNTRSDIAKYQAGYRLFWVPFLLVMVCVFFAYLRVPNPEKLEAALNKPPEPDKLSKVFWIYTAFTLVATVGFVNFALLGYHFKAKGVLSDAQIPLFYAIAMAVDGVAALAIGKAYDVMKHRSRNEKAGLLTLVAIPFLSALIPLLAFSMNIALVAVSVLLWGVVMGIHETIMKSAIADLTPMKKRGTGYGIFNTVYGVAMFIGAALMGVLYDVSLPLLIGVTIGIELLAVPIFAYMWYDIRSVRG
ncbi:MAG TPA: MFS transporter [Candidatus Omnitrophota bacterium]|nr:MFS transporter [Candidatus Omnitrophota bacterium]HRZ67143.1 MFS transporter [Candidatus Omnitrophota bacterium]